MRYVLDERLDRPSGVWEAWRVVNLPLVGRAQELEQLQAALCSAQLGRGSIHFVSGGPGLGKTALLEHLAQQASSTSFRLLWGRCSELGGTPSFWPWIQVLRALYRSLPAEFADDLRADQGTVLGQLLPELLSSQSSRAPGHSHVEEARFQLLDATSRLLAEAAEEKPLLILFEDLHVADRATVQLLDFVEPAVRTSSILIIGTLRELEGLEKLPELFPLLQRSGHLSLSPLGREQTQEYLEGALGYSHDEPLLEQIYATTEGHPLFLSETARMLRQRGDAALSEVIPPTLETAIKKRALSFTAAAREVLRVAAVLGRDFNRSALVHLVAPSILKEGLEPALSSGLILRKTEDSYRFEHILVQNAFYRDVEESERRKVHATHARNLELGLTTSVLERHSEVAHHYVAAERAEDALAALGRAAELSLQRLAVHDAVMILERGAQIMNHPTVGSRPRAEHMLRLARARLASSDLSGGKELCRMVAEEARRLNDAELLVQAALTCGSVFVLAQVDPLLVALLRDALSRLPEEPGRERVLLLARLAAALQPAPDPNVPFALAEEALHLARLLDDPETLLDVLRSVGSAFMDLAPPAQRLRLNEEYAALAEELQDQGAAFRAHCWLAFDHFELGEVERARQQIQTVEELAALLDQPHFTWRAIAFRATSLGFSGYVAQALSILEAAEEVATRAHDPNATRALATLRIWLKSMRSPQEDRSSEEAVLASLGGQVYDELTIWGSWARAGRVEELKPQITPDKINQSLAAHDLAVNGELTEVAIAVQDTNLAARLYEALLPHAHRFGIGGMTGMTWHAPAHLTLGRLALFLNRSEEAFQHLTKSIELLERTRSFGYLAWAHLAFAKWGVCTRNEEVVRRSARRARELATDLRYPHLVAAADAILERRPSGDFSAHPSSDSRPASFTEKPLALLRQGEIWEVTFRHETLRLKDTKGLRLLDQLIREPEREFHVLDLESPSQVVDGGDSGELLDEAARRAYRARLEDLAAQLIEATEHNDLGRITLLEREREQLTTEIARAVGMGGSSRRAGSATERARVNVQRRLKDAVRRIREQSPELARHVSRRLKTGTYCSYED